LPNVSEILRHVEKKATGKITTTLSESRESKSNFSDTQSQATGAAGEGVTPVRGIKYVSLHPDRLLRDERTCTQVIKLSYASNINYSEAIIGLRNRALLVGGNAISIVGWAESASSSGLVGKIYLCKKKPFHIHW